MDDEAFQGAASDIARFITEYLKNVKDLPVTPSVAPGYLQQLLPAEAPQEPDRWEDVMKDVQDKILPGFTNWQHPHFHAYFPGGTSYPSMLAEMLSGGLGSVSFTWISCPAMTELETVMIDWIGKLMKLPKELLPYTEGCNGGGVIQASSSECTLVCMFAARTRVINRLKEENPDVDDCVLLARLVAYLSEEAHSSVEKAADISFVKRRLLPTDDKLSLRGDTLRKAIEIDEANGLVPFFVCGTVGTTGSTAVDNIEELGQICHEKNLWLHVDGAYGGNALICPEYHYLLRGFEYVTSFNYNPVKWMRTSLDCSVMWIRNKRELIDALSIDRIYYMDTGDEMHMLDYRNWCIPLSRRFRALKLWFVIRLHGVEGLQDYIRSHVRLAKLFASYVEQDDRFEVLGEVILGLVCFRLKGENKLTESLLQLINESGKAHMIPTTMKGKYVIRFCPSNWHYSEEITKEAWAIVTEQADAVLRRHRLAAQRFQKLLGKYKDYARAQLEAAAAGGEEEEPGEIRDEVSWGGMLHNLGYRIRATEQGGTELKRVTPAEGSERRRRTAPNSFKSLSLKFWGEEGSSKMKRPSESLFS